MASHVFSREPKPVPSVRSNHRTIQTAIPAPGTAALLATLDQVESRSMHGQLPLVWHKAKGHSIYDHAGNRWIDFTSTIFVTNIGHAHEHLKERLQEVLSGDLLHSYAYANEIRARYLKKLVAFAHPLEKAFLLSSGTEATEAALKLMRMQGQKKNKRRLGVVCIEGNWHGRTMGAQMMSSNTAQKAWIGYQDPDIHHIPFPYPWKVKGESGREFFSAAMEELRKKGIDFKQDICGFMLETFQGWGAIFYPQDFVKAVSDFSRDHDALLAFDEMQAGFGRTGKRFGFEHYNVAPDLIAVGKGMGSGLPLSGVIGRSEIMDLPEVGNMSSTHSANPLVCAAGLATLEVLESENLVVESERKGKLFFDRLNALKTRYPKHISHVLGNGMIAAVLFRDPETGEPNSALPSMASEKAMQKGLLVVHTGRESIKMGPPLCIPDEALMEGIDVLEESIRECIKK